MKVIQICKVSGNKQGVLPNCSAVRADKIYLFLTRIWQENVYLLKKICFSVARKNYPYYQNLDNIDVAFHHRCCLDTHISSSFVLTRPLNQSTFLMRHCSWSSDEVFWWITKDGAHHITEGKQWERAIKCYFLKYSSSFKQEIFEKIYLFLLGSGSSLSGCLYHIDLGVLKTVL